MVIDSALEMVTNLGDSLIQAAMIIGMIVFLVWNVKLVFEDIKEV